MTLLPARRRVVKPFAQVRGIATEWQNRQRMTHVRRMLLTGRQCSRPAGRSESERHRPRRHFAGTNRAHESRTYSTGHGPRTSCAGKQYQPDLRRNAAQAAPYRRGHRPPARRPATQRHPRHPRQPPAAEGRTVAPHHPEAPGPALARRCASRIPLRCRGSRDDADLATCMLHLSTAAKLRGAQ